MNSGKLNYKNATENAQSLTHLSNKPVLGMLLIQASLNPYIYIYIYIYIHTHTQTYIFLILPISGIKHFYALFSVIFSQQGTSA